MQRVNPTTRNRSFRSFVAAALLLTCGALLPACDVFNPNPCEPSGSTVCPKPPPVGGVKVSL